MFTGFEIIACCLYLIAGVQTEKVSEEIKDNENLRRDRNTYRVDPARRSIVEDAQWQVSHLRDMDVSPRRSGCKEETFEEKELRYRKSLQNDAALVQYVSSDALKVDEKDKVGNVCYMPEAVESIFNFHNNSGKAKAKETVKKLKSNKTEEVKAKNATANVETATVHDGKGSKDLRRKPSEYEFSSIEYYDTVPTFNTPAVCPESVVEVYLEIEHIKDYDVQCELLIEWRSLD